MTTFEFDPEKSQNNKEKHGIDFVEGQKLWLDPLRAIVDAKSLTEPRSAIIGQIDGKLWTGIFTMRNENTRIISIRRSREKEGRIYYENF